MGDVVDPAVKLGAGGQFTEQDQVGGLEETGFLGELLDRITAVLQDALVAIDEGDRALGRSGVLIGRIEAHHAEIIRLEFDLAQVHCPQRVVFNWEFIVGTAAVVRDGKRNPLPFHAPLAIGCAGDACGDITARNCFSVGIVTNFIAFGQVPDPQASPPTAARWLASRCHPGPGGAWGIPRRTAPREDLQPSLRGALGRRSNLPLYM